MNVTRIISQTEEYLNSNKRKLKSKIKYLKHVMKTLRKREKKLQACLQAGQGDEKKMCDELALIHAQRSKGVKLLQAMKAERKARKQTKKTQNDNP